MARAKQRTIDLESYEGFLENLHYQDCLTINQLNQIIYMHGFTKLHRSPKKVLIGALSTIDLLIPLRSTLKEIVSLNASIPIDEVNEDLDILEWQECPVRSVETVKFSLREVQQRYQQLTGGDLLPIRYGHTKRVSETEMAFGNTTKKPRSKRR